MTVALRDSGAVYEGRYNVDYPAKRLVLRYNGAETEFVLEDDYMIRDFTRYYRRKYPESGVETARLKIKMERETV